MTEEPSLPRKVVAVVETLTRGAIGHALGGAIALGFYAPPRATADIDLNLFVGVEEAPGALAALAELDVRAGVADREAIRRDGQVRLRWGRTPLDLFFATLPFHERAATRTRRVPFAGSTIAVLAIEDLVVCKAAFDRPRDWVDIGSVLEAGTPLDPAVALAEAAEILGTDDHRWRRLARVLTASDV